jgi:hypothetical protein
MSDHHQRIEPTCLFGQQSCSANRPSASSMHNSGCHRIDGRRKSYTNGSKRRPSEPHHMDRSSPALEDVWNLSCLINGYGSGSEKCQASSLCSDAETVSAGFERDLSLASLAPTMIHTSSHCYNGEPPEETMVFAMELWNDGGDNRKNRSLPASPVRSTSQQKDHKTSKCAQSLPTTSTSQFWPPQLELRGRQEEWQINIEVRNIPPKKKNQCTYKPKMDQSQFFYCARGKFSPMAVVDPCCTHAHACIAGQAHASTTETSKKLLLRCI